MKIRSKISSFPLPLILAIILSSLSIQALGTISDFTAYLNYHNGKSSTKITYDKWYNLKDMIKKNDDLVMLMKIAQKENINIIVDSNDTSSEMSNERFITSVRTNTNYSTTYLIYDMHYGIVYSNSSRNFKSYRVQGDRMMPLTREGIPTGMRFLIPSNKTLQSNFHRNYDYFEDIANLISIY